MVSLAMLALGQPGAAQQPSYRSSAMLTKYSLAYVPTETAADERFRHIDVGVTTNLTYRARARTGYAANPALAAMNR